MTQQPTACTDMELSLRICAKESPDREAALKEFVNATLEHNAKAFANLAYKWGIRDVNDHFNDTYIGFCRYSLKMGRDQKLIENLCGAFYTIGRNILSNVVRGRKGSLLQNMNDLTANITGEPDPEIERIINPDPDEQALIAEALKQMSEDDRLIIDLYHYEGLSHQQIAERLGVAVEASRNRLSRARERLRKTLHDLLGNPENKSNYGTKLVR